MLTSKPSASGFWPGVPIALALDFHANLADDVIDLAEPVLKHRMALTFAARAEGIEIGDMVAKLVEPLG